MPSLVQIPWQPTIWLTPRTLDRLNDASHRLGRNIYLNGADAGWRSYDRQKYLWDINGHNPAKANNPDIGQRAHMKGGGLDVPVDAATRKAMKDAAFRPDANEAWHWNDPDIAFMPIIRTNPAVAGGTSIPITADQPAPPKPKGQDMFLIQVAEDGEVDLVTDRGIIRIQQASHRDLFLRMFAKFPDIEVFAGPQRDIITGYLAGVGSADQAGILTALGKIGTVDTVPIVKAVVAAVKGSGATITDENITAIANAVDAQLADNFSKLELKNQLK